MAKQIIGTDVGGYSFNAATRQVTLTGLSTLNLEQVLLITNVTSNIVIYQFNSSSLGATIASNVLTLVYNTTGQSNTDKLQIIIDYAQQTLPVSSASLPLPTGASTSALQTTANLSLAAIALNTVNAGTPVVSGTVSVSNFPATQNVAVTSTVSTPVTGSFYQATQPVSAASLPLPIGASTDALQTTANSSLSSIDSKTPTLVSGRQPVDGSGVTQPVSASSLPLPTGAATSAKQDTGNTSVASIDTKTISQADTQAIGSISGSSALTMDVTNFGTLSFTVSGTWTGTIVTELSIDASSWFSTSYVALASGNTSNSFTANTAGQVNTVGFNFFRLRGATISSGTAFLAYVASLAVSNVMLDNPLPAGSNNIGNINNITGTISIPTGASTSALQTTGNTSLASIDTKLTNPLPISGTVSTGLSQPLTDTQLRATAVPVSTPDLFITGQAAQTAIINNIIPVTAGANATDCSGYKSFSIQVVSTATAGSVIFEGSNDNVNFQVVPVYNQALANPAILLSSITATASTIIYTGSVQVRYLRLRILTTITGGSIQAFTRLSTNSFAQTVTNVAQAVAGSLLTTATITSGTITTVTSANLSIPTLIADVASAALTTTTTTATLTPTFGISYEVNIPVTVVSGTSPTLDVSIEESDDTGTNWYKVYDFPRITATGMYRSPAIPFLGNRVRYVQTVGGTTPSFTRAVNRLQSSYPAIPQRQLIDRTIVLTTLNSTTALILARDCGNGIQLMINIGAATTAPILQLEGSDDFGTTWYSIGTPLTAVANSTVQLTVNGTNAAALRARVSTAGVGVTAGYVLIKAHD